MLFDEPTSALDPEMIHEVGFADRVANRVVFMDHGQILEDVEAEAFFTAPRSERGRDFLSKILNH